MQRNNLSLQEISDKLNSLGPDEDLSYKEAYEILFSMVDRSSKQLIEFEEIIRDYQSTLTMAIQYLDYFVPQEEGWAKLLIEDLNKLRKSKMS